MNNTWKAELKQKLIKVHGSSKGETLYNKYADAFPTSYREECSADTGVMDIKHLKTLSTENNIDLDFYRLYASDKSLHFKLYQLGQAMPLSELVPILENLDLQVLSEHPYKILLKDDSVIWISDFTVIYKRDIDFDIKEVRDIFQRALLQSRLGLTEDDGFNKLVLGAQLIWRDIEVLRAYAKYLRQTGFRFSQPYIEQALANNAGIAKDLVNLFKARLDPKQKRSSTTADELEKNILKNLDRVASSDEDRIIRQILQVIKATLRTNFFQTTADGNPKPYFSIKLRSKDVPDLPLPRPLYEIFVYSARFEGIHLRSAKVARGGIRWSDRPEDFRTEILGLMKAQIVKNSVIVPSGAKGGFVLKKLQALHTREETYAEAVYCYKEFICGLLDITDNIKNNKIVSPPNVFCYDDNDPYLVVAADKGTATFSDLANSISSEYHFWLGDAFASGGSEGYDHKKIGITARGAWESIKRHFHELNIDTSKTDFTMIGIGDMSGDVFGNALIYSQHIKLVAAFDHRNIFLDPNPDPSKSYNERVRLFHSPNSSWEDYNPKLISAGGGVYKRLSKTIPISPEIKKVLQIDDNSLTPTELIRAILKAPVDLLFNGGIGTYVKASTESSADVGDKANEFSRVNGDELRCRIVAEGGNLGFTQLGRIEYCTPRRIN